jgi:Fe2+ transport system protein FeoA
VESVHPHVVGLQPEPITPKVPPVSKVKTASRSPRECPQAARCSLDQVGAGTVVRVKELMGCPEMSQRLREMGLCEEQQIKMLLKGSSLVCQVCNVRLGLSSKLAEDIIVEPVPKRAPHPA